jgi:hypothetical protein
MTFTAKITPTLTPEAQRLVDVYDQTPGSSGPYCNPAGLAAVLEVLQAASSGYDDLLPLARELRGESIPNNPNWTHMP